MNAAAPGAVPECIELQVAGTEPAPVLVRCATEHAEAVATAVRESMEHLRRFMPWADDRSTDPAFQRERIAGLAAKWTAGESYDWFLIDATGSLRGGFGLMARRGAGTLEIGYWLHPDAVGRGFATAAAGELTDVALARPGITTVLIYCDVANVRSCAIPRRLGYTLDRIERVPPQAADETGRHMVWVRRLGAPLPA